MSRFRTVAHWPKDVTGLADSENRSFDIHDSFEAARAVADMLMHEGFGGNHLIMPIQVDIEELTDDSLGFRAQFSVCRRDSICQLGEKITETAIRYYVRDDSAEGGVKMHWGPKDFTGQVYLCGKFGGICSSGNMQCLLMRGGNPDPANLASLMFEYDKSLSSWWRRLLSR